MKVENPTKRLQDIVRALNDGFNKEHPLHAEAHANLARLIQAWQQAQSAPPNHFELKHKAPLPTLLKMKLPPGCPNWREIEKRCRAYLPPSGTGAYTHVEYVGEPPWTAWDFAAQHFIWLITNPERDKFAGPCRRCGKYYIKKRASQTAYCSRRCGNAATAVIRTRERLEAEHRDKLNMAKQGQCEWNKERKKGRTRQGWKEFVSARYPYTTPKFLTRAANKGELSEPANERI